MKKPLLSCPRPATTNLVATVKMRQYLGRIDTRSTVGILDQMVVSGTSFLTTVIIGRLSGSAGLGLFALAMSGLVFVNGAQASLVSTPYTVFRSRGGNRTHDADAGASLAGAILLAGVLIAFAMVAAITISFLASGWQVTSLVWAVVLTIPLYLGREFARRFDFARLHMAGALVVDVGVAALQIVLLLTLGLQGHLTSAIAILVIGASCGTMVAFWFVRRRNEFSLSGAKLMCDSIRRDWMFGRWLFADHLICVAQVYAMHWLLTAFVDTSATGTFVACASIATLANPFLYGVGNYVSPRLAETVSLGSRRETLRVYWRTTILLCIVVSCFTAIATVFGSALLQLLYHDSSLMGHGVIVGLLAMRLMWAIPTIAADHAIVAMEYPRGSALATLAGLGTTIGLAIPLILWLGVLGAAISLLFGTGVESVVLITVFIRRLNRWKWNDSPWSHLTDDETDTESDNWCVTS